MPNKFNRKKPSNRRGSVKKYPGKESNHLFLAQFLAILGILIIILGAFFYWQQSNRSLHVSDPKQIDPTTQVQPEENKKLPEQLPQIVQPTPQSPGVPLPRQQILPQQSSQRIPIVIVIDDVGYDLSLLERFLRIPVPITYAVLPGVPHTTESALLLGLYNQEIILHLPMENVLGLDPGPGTIWDYMTDQEIRDQLRVNIQQIPGLVGMNNHMGSKGTQDRRIMSIVLEVVKELELFFLDSRTTAQSVVAELSKAKNLPFLERHVFLDNETNRDAIIQALQTGLEQASTRGYAVMIGHVWTQELADIILELYPEILDQGFDFVSLADLLQFNSQE